MAGKAESKDEAHGGAGGEAPAKSGRRIKLPVVVALVNTVAVLATLGLLIYTKMMYKHPKITEEKEQEKLTQAFASPKAPAPSVLIEFPPVTVNILSNPVQPKPAPGKSAQIEGKLHYASLGFSIEIRDEKMKDLIEEIRPVLMDRILGMVGRKSPQELASVQGRYVFRSQLIDVANELVEATKIQPAITGGKKARGKKQAAPAEPLVTNVFFSQFIVQ